MSNRSITITRRVDTEFGAMYVHIDVDPMGRVVGGSISTPGKEPESQIQRLIDTLSKGLEDACTPTLSG